MHSRPLWIGTSWKMNKGPAAAIEAARSLAAFHPPVGVQPFVIPPFTSLRDVCAILEGTSVLVGAQNTHWEDEGPWTGEISPVMLAECGAALVEIGHSERRAHFGETDWTVNLKVHAVLRHGMRPLVCIGDTAEEHAFGVTHDVLARQLRIALHGVPPALMGQVLVAYEPVWAIGAGGRAADATFVAHAHARLRAVLVEIAGEDAGHEIPLLYGGSVTRDNACGYARLADVDGVFIGRAAWNVADFRQIIGSVAHEHVAPG
ncbi:triose-phosphate isomerase [Gluconacetobacter entanii]|uniref:triose-phosphate isomerase n=1 Tax=Gluconacetobacter entanii TaxID=108528 RepID=UPI001C9337EC|nr:triose-phosphate isomerase [Gluconacetobacter entanii]MBY4638795.1 triose-phosphate isomerase [Gluconacetobacter entanii]MCW4580749.1 triose-phosphate isomerase [Gluconacetobacter entanii]MCW4584078.1 triose-phosphate isomerase [Gluconacetobacter entanii]MCW4587458.1 triose-phosphate isomerase [Gluconacetobacter entanii]